MKPMAFISAGLLPRSPIFFQSNTTCPVRNRITSWRGISVRVQNNTPNLSYPSTTTTIEMRRGSGSMPPAPTSERIFSILAYVIPLLDSLTFGTTVFARVPLLRTLILTPLVPFYSIYRGVPFLAFGVFLALYLLVVRNTSISRYVRFNVYQALILDIALIIPQLFQGVNISSVVPAVVGEVCSTAVFYAISFAIIYAVVQNVKGQVPDEIPAISDSVNQQMGPF